MSPYGKQTKSYERVPEPGSPRETESWALIEAAKRMAAALTLGKESNLKAMEQRKSAVKLNWKLWTIFQAELTIEKSETAEEIRLNMLTLCKFVDKHTIGTLIEPTDEKILTLIDLNRNIALGLLNVPEEETEKKAMEQAGNSFSNTGKTSSNNEQPNSQKIEISV